MTLSQIKTASIASGAVDTAQLAADAVDNTILDLTDDFAFTGTVSGAGGLVLLNTVTLDNNTTASVTFDETYINSTYDNYVITIHWQVETDSQKLAARFLETGGTEISDSNYARNIGSNYYSIFATGEDHLEISQNVGTGGGGNEKGAYAQWFLNMKDSDNFQPSIVGQVMLGNTANNLVQQLTAGKYKGSTDVTGGIKFYNHGGANFSSGSQFKLYGMTQ